jgi:hypothetical protein
MGGSGVTSRIERGRRSALAGVVGALAFLAFGAGSANAATCDTSWKLPNSGAWSDAANWTAGVPTSADDACITLPGAYTVDITGQSVQAKSLQLGGSTGTQTLSIVGATANQATLTLAAGGSISGNGLVDLSANCAASNCVAFPAAAIVNTGATPLSNSGSIISAVGSDSGVNGRGLSGNFTNTGTIELPESLQFASGTLNNQGTLSIDSGAILDVPQNPIAGTATVTNGAGGLITNNGANGYVKLGAQNIFNQGAGTTSPSSVNPAHPAVLINDPLFNDPAPTLNYTGAGASAIEVRGKAKLSGDIASGQSLNINGVAGCPSETLVTAAVGFSNAGTLTLGGACDSGLAITNGNLTNTGTLVAATTGSGVTRELKGGLINSGTFNVNGDTAFDKGGATLMQTGGSTAFPLSSVTLDPSGSGSTFQLQGGTLSGGGNSGPAAAIINGPVNNSGGSVIPGSTSTPGIMTVNGYTQALGGKLTITINGTSVGSGYSQLSSLANATISGLLTINTLSGPTAGHLYTIVGAQGTRSGEFSKVTGRFAPEGPFPPGWTSGYKVDYEFPNAVALDAEAASGLRVKRAGPGTGSVTSSPAGINCGSTCDAPFFHTQTVTLTAHPGSGWAFGGWSGACSGSSRTCKVKMSKARTVTASFSHGTTTRLSSSRNPGRKGKRVTYTATVSPHPDGGTVKFTGRGGQTIAGCRSVAVSTSTGKAKCSTIYHTTGSRPIKATYLGDRNFAPSSASLTERIKR